MLLRWRRAVATVVGLWFALSVSGVALQLCPSNGMPMMAGMHETGTHNDRAAGHHARDASHAPARHDSHHHNSSDDCTCTGMCCVTATVTLAAAPVVATTVVEVEAPAITPVGTSELTPRAAPDVNLPPPIGPPTLRA